MNMDCKRRKLGDKIEESSSSSSSSSCQRRKWEELDLNILRKIFSMVAVNDAMANMSKLMKENSHKFFENSFRVSSYDTITNIYSVCRSWRLACWDVLFWGKNKDNMVDLTPAMAAQLYNPDTALFYLTNQVKVRFHYFDGNTDESLIRFLKTIFMDDHYQGSNYYDAFGFSLEQWRLSVKKIFVPRGLYISDQHLSFLAQRTPNLESLILVNSSRLTREGVSKAIFSWKKIKHITFEFVEPEQQFELRPFLELSSNVNDD